MDYDFILNIDENINPEDLLSKHLKYKNNIFILHKIIGIGGYKIIYELKNIKTDEINYVLKVYRVKLTITRVNELKEIYMTLKNINIPVPDEHIYIDINGWTVIFETHLASPNSDTIILSNNSVIQSSVSLENRFNLEELLTSNIPLEGVKLCYKMIDKYPFNLFYRSLMVDIYRNSLFPWLVSASELIILYMDNGVREERISKSIYDIWSGKTIKIKKENTLDEEINIYLNVATEYLIKMEELVNIIHDLDEEDEYFSSSNKVFEETLSLYKDFLNSPFFN